MGGIDLVVTVRDEHERARRLHPPPEHSENVEGGLVSPVDVLEHEHGRSLELGDEDAAQLSRSGSGLDRSRDPTAGLSRNVEERPEGRRCRQAVAGAVQHRRVDALAEGACERRLADAGLTADEEEATAGRVRLRELSQQLLPLE